jgi:hypothetical protein
MPGRKNRTMRKLRQQNCNSTLAPFALFAPVQCVLFDREAQAAEEKNWPNKAKFARIPHGGRGLRGGESQLALGAQVRPLAVIWAATNP